MPEKAKTLFVYNKGGSYMRDEYLMVIALVIGALLSPLYIPSIGEALDQEFGDYRKHNVQYLNKTK